MQSFFIKFLYVVGRDRNKLLFVLFFFTLTSLIDAIGIGLMGPFISIASNPSILKTNAISQSLTTHLNLSKSEYLIPILGFIIVVIFLLQFVLYVISQQYIFNFIYRLKMSLVMRLSNAYLYAPYTFHLTKNSASINKNVVMESQAFASRCLSAVMRVLTNTIILVILLLLLAKTDLTFLLLILLTTIPTVIGFQFFAPKLRAWGKSMSLTQESILKILSHSLGSIKDTKVLGVENYFLNQLEEQSREETIAFSRFQVAQVVPPFIIKSSLIIFLVIFISVVTVFSQDNMQNLGSTMAVFAIASIRLIPSANFIVQAMGELKSTAYTLDVLYFDLKEIEEQHLELTATPLPSHQQMAFQQKLVIQNLGYTYPSSQKPAIEQINLTLQKGESIALIGKSGSGKTTLVDVILGLLEPQQGDILVDGISVYENLRSWQNLVGYIPQSIFLTDESIEQNIAFGVPEPEIDPDRLAQAIHSAQLEELIQQLPQGVKTLVGERGVRLSGGQRQRIGIARALYHEREILVLDEATSALDNETEKLVTESIQSLAGQKTMIIIAHRLSTVEHCDRLYVLEKGHIGRTGTYQEVVLSELAAEN